MNGATKWIGLALSIVVIISGIIAGYSQLRTESRIRQTKLDTHIVDAKETYARKDVLGEALQNIRDELVDIKADQREIKAEIKEIRKAQ